MNNITKNGLVSIVVACVGCDRFTGHHGAQPRPSSLGVRESLFPVPLPGVVAKAIGAQRQLVAPCFVSDPPPAISVATPRSREAATGVGEGQAQGLMTDAPSASNSPHLRLCKSLLLYVGTQIHLGEIPIW